MWKLLLAVTPFALLLIIAASAKLVESHTRELLVTAPGGTYTDTLKLHIASFEAQNGITVHFVPASGAEALAMARAKQIDVIQADMAWAFRGEAEGVFERLDPAVVTNLSTLYPRARLSPYSVITNFGQYGLAYNPDTINSPPTSWYDLLRPQYKGRVSTAGFDDANVELLVLFAKLNGGGEDNIDPGFQKMAQLSKNITMFFSSHAQLLDLFRSGDIWIARWLRGRVSWAKRQGVDVRFAVPREGAIALVTTAHVVRGRTNSELAMRFVNYLLSKECEMAYARNLGYTPSRADLDLKGKQYLDVPYGADAVNSLVMADWRKVSPKLDGWRERWDKEIVR